MGQTFLEEIERRYGAKVRNEASKLLVAMDLPDPAHGEYLRGTEACMLFLDRYGIILRVGEAGDAPEHDLVLRPLRSAQIEGERESDSIAILPGVEGVARSYDEVDVLSERLKVDGINFWDPQKANCGYIRSRLHGFENGVLVVVDRGAVSKKDESATPAALKTEFDKAVFAGLQEKVFAPFVKALEDWPQEHAAPAPDDAKAFLYRCAGDIHQGENSTLRREWNRNEGAKGFGDKPSIVVEKARTYESRLKRRDHDRCLFYASLPFAGEKEPPMNTAHPAALPA